MINGGTATRSSLGTKPTTRIFSPWIRPAIRAHAARSSRICESESDIPIDASSSSSEAGATMRGSLPVVWSIVHVLSSFGVGGQERVALDLAIGQRARGHTVSVISLAPPPDGAMADEFREHGIAVDRVPKRAGLDPTLVPRLAKRLRELRAQVVHTHNPLPLIYGAPAARL